MTGEELLRLCEDELYAIGQNSWSRPHTALGIAKSICNGRPDVAWRFIMDAWSGFDLIPHDEYRRLFNRRAMREWWCPGYMTDNAKQFYDNLPARLTIYRGQDASHDVGLSWTTDMEVAKRFGRGHRGSFNPDPVVLQSRVSKKEIVFVTVEREESETVLWKVPKEVVIIDRVGMEAAE